MTAPQTPTPQLAHEALTTGQRAQLESTLLSRVRELERRLLQHHEGSSRVEHARDLLEQDADDASQHAMDREVDLGLSDLEMRELDALGLALSRLQQPDFGSCATCGGPIPFERLQVEPQARRCVACESGLEARQAWAK